MDEHLVNFIRDRFNKVDADNSEMLSCLKSHIEKDEEYWRKIDDQDAQLRLVKAVGGTGIVASALGWIWQRFGH